MSKTMKAAITCIFLLCITVICLSSCKAKPAAKPQPESKAKVTATDASTQPPVGNLTLSAPESRLEPGSKMNFSLTADDGKDYLPEAEWIISNPEAVKVEKGVLTAVAVGSSSVSAKVGDTVSNEVSISSEIFVTGVVMSAENMELLIGQSVPIGATPQPDNATNKDLKWQSTDPSVARIEGNGVVGCKVGECVLSVMDSRGIKMGQCTVKVLPVLAASVSVENPTSAIAVGQRTIMNAAVAPANVTDKAVIWSSSNPQVASVTADGIVTGVQAGQAVIQCRSHDGNAVGEAGVEITSASSASTYYALERTALRRGCSSKEKVLGYGERDEACALLWSSNGWYLVNTSAGAVGYAPASAFSSTKPVRIGNVPYINQFDIGLPTGCEAVSAAMLLKYYGYNVSSEQVIAAMTHGEAKHQNENGEWIGANPFEAFVGDPHLQRNKGSWGVFASPVVKAMNRFCGGRAKDVSGCSQEQIYQYLLDGKPMVMWCTAGGKDLVPGVVWKYPDGSGSFQELVNEHCVVLIGMDSKYVYLNDPSKGQNSKQTKATFFANWKILYSQAIVLQ